MADFPRRVELPEYLISNKSEISRYARIDSKGIAFVDQENATGFSSPEAALKAFEKAVGEAWSKGQAKAKMAREKKTIIADADSGYWVKASELVYLPPCSPNLNLIERLWKLMNEEVRDNAKRNGRR